MFRRNQGSFFSSNSRLARRSEKAQLRAHRSDSQWTAIHQHRKDRIAKWKRIFRPFVPINLTRFRAAMGMFLSVLANFFSGQSHRNCQSVCINRSGMFNFGGKKKKRKNRKTARTKSKLNNSNSYNELEQRQLLAADFSLDFAGMVLPTELEDGTSAQSNFVVNQNVTFNGSGQTDSEIM